MEAIDLDDPSILNETWRNTVQAGSPGFLPTAALPIIENMTNHSFFRDRPIVSRSREGMPPELQYGGNTSEAAKKLGEWVNYSPAKIDNIIQGWTGGLGRYVTQAIDVALKGTGIANPPPDPSPRAADRPVIKAFIIPDPYGSSSESVNRFYKELERFERGEKYMKEMLRLGEEAKFEAFKKKHPDVLLFYDYELNDHYSASARYFRKIARYFSDVRKVQTAIYDARDLTPQEKRTKIDELNKKLTEYARGALDKYGIGAAGE